MDYLGSRSGREMEESDRTVHMCMVCSVEQRKYLQCCQLCGILLNFVFLINDYIEVMIMVMSLMSFHQAF